MCELLTKEIMINVNTYQERMYVSILMLNAHEVLVLTAT